MSSKPKTVRQTLESIPKEETASVVFSKKPGKVEKRKKTTRRPRKAYNNKTIKRSKKNKRTIKHKKR